MKVLFSTVNDTYLNELQTGCAAESTLLQICRTEQPDQIYLWMQTEHAENVSALLAAYCNTAAPERTVDIQTAPFPADDFSESVRSLLTMFQTEQPDAEILVNLLACDPVFAAAMQNVAAGSAQNIRIMADAQPASAPVQLTKPQPAEIAAPADNTELKRNMLREILFSLLDQYEYTAALQICKTNPELIPQQFTDLLTVTALRSQGQFAAALQQNTACNTGSKAAFGTHLAEYYLLLDLAVKKKQYSAFLHSVTPLVIELMILALQKLFQMDVTQYMIYASRKWDENKLVLAQLTGKFSESYTYHTKPKPCKVGGFVTTVHLSNLMENLSVPKRDGNLILDNLKLRQDTEIKMQTLAKHTLRGVTAEDIQKACTRTPEELLQMVCNYARNYTDLALDDAYVNTYQTLNNELKAMFA